MPHNVQFEEEQQYRPRRQTVSRDERVSGITSFLVRKGVVKDSRQAQVILLVLVTISIFAAFYFFGTIGRDDYTTEAPPSPDDSHLPSDQR